MMKKILLIPSIFLSLVLGSCSTSRINTARLLLQDEKNVVTKGDVINVEKRTLVHNSESKEVNGQIILPDGSSKNGKSFTVTSPGIYKVVYSALFGFEEVKETVTYECYRTSGDLFISSHSNVLVNNGEYSFNNTKVNYKGAKLPLNSYVTFTYDGIIDFNTFDKNEPFFEFIVDTTKQEESDLESFTVRLTDIEDDHNYVDISITDSGPVDDDGRGCYILAGANGQYKTGYEWGKLHVNRFGANVGSSFRALPKDAPKNARLYFDYKNRALYVDPIINSNVKDIITDLDSKDIYGNHGWNGFTTGKARISIFANSLSNAVANVIVSKIANMDLTDDVYIDTKAPEINLKYENQLPNDLPNALVGVPFKIFEAEIKDNFDKTLSYSTSVIYHDTVNSVTKDVSVVDGAFTPKKAGKYTIIYSTKDYFDNVSTKQIDIIAVDNQQELSISIDEEKIEQDIYSTFNIPSVDDVHVEGGSGKACIERHLYNSSFEEIVLEGDSFIPEEPGDFIVSYIATDYIGNVASTTLKLKALAVEKPIFIDEFVLPRILVKGHAYTLPSITGAEVVNNEVKHLQSDIYVNGTKLNDNSFEASDTCDVVYKLNGQTGLSEYNTSFTVVDGKDSSDQAAYFYGDFDEVNENKNNIALISSHDASTLFASLLPYDNPTVTFEIDRSKTNYQYLLLKLSDNKNPNISLTYKVDFTSENTQISALNGDESSIFTFESRGGKEIYTFNYLNEECSLYDFNYAPMFAVDKDDNGNPFNGFVNGLYLDISIVGVTAESELVIDSVSNQDFGHNDYYQDFSSPIIIFNNVFKNEQKYGEKAYIPSVDVFDILSDATAKVSVRAPSGNFKIRNENAAEPHYFDIDEFGTYLVTYSAEDKAGNMASYPRKIVVYDNIAPTLEIEYNLKETYGINSSVRIPNYKVTDNLENYTLNVFLILPNDEERMLLLDKSGEVTSYLASDNVIYNSSFKVDNRTFRLEQYGKYILRFVAYDEAFNKVVKEYSFVVK